jgi:uncharacterized protein YfaT (DUF1175 family)
MVRAWRYSDPLPENALQIWEFQRDSSGMVRMALDEFIRRHRDEFLPVTC